MTITKQRGRRGFASSNSSIGLPGNSSEPEAPAGELEEGAAPGQVYGRWAGYRVVIPRNILSADSNRVQQVAWKGGYGTRIASRTAGAVIVEFLESVEELPAPTELRDHEATLERLLASNRANAPGTGRGAWLETIQPRIGRAHRSRG